MTRNPHDHPYRPLLAAGAPARGPIIDRTQVCALCGAWKAEHEVPDTPMPTEADWPAPSGRDIRCKNCGGRVAGPLPEGGWLHTEGRCSVNEPLASDEVGVLAEPEEEPGDAAPGLAAEVAEARRQDRQQEPSFRLARAASDFRLAEDCLWEAAAELDLAIRSAAEGVPCMSPQQIASEVGLPLRRVRQILGPMRGAAVTNQPIDMNAIVTALRRRGFAATVEQTGGGTATIYAGVEIDGRYGALGGPGHFPQGWTGAADEPAEGLVGEFCVGYDDDGEGPAVYVGTTDPEAIADEMARRVQARHAPADEEHAALARMAEEEVGIPAGRAGTDHRGYYIACPECGRRCYGRVATVPGSDETKGANYAYALHYEGRHQ